MIPTSEPLSMWLNHIGGETQLEPKAGRRVLTEAVELNKEAKEIISTFGCREFWAVVGFIDMKGFSTQARGKPPKEVLAIAKPFVDAVVCVATRRQWFIDKTIGDEVMVICPFFGQDVQLADKGLKHRDPDIAEISSFVSELIKELENNTSSKKFSAGFAMGNIILDRIGTDRYSEWTCYGNVVNTAKRLQAHHPKDFANTNWLAVGSNRHDYPSIEGNLDAWLNIWQATGCLQLLSPQKEMEFLNGVGETVFVKTGVSLKPGC